MCARGFSRTRERPAVVHPDAAIRVDSELACFLRLPRFALRLALAMRGVLLALPPAGARVAAPARRAVSRRRRFARASASADDAGGSSPGGSSSSSRAREIRLEKARALRDELDGVGARSRRLLARAGRLVERVAELDAAATRAMTNPDRDEDEARRLLVEKRKVRETLDLAMARAEVLQQLSSKLESAIIVLEAAPLEEDRREPAPEDARRGGGDPAPPPPRQQPRSTMTEESLEREFAKLEISQLERMFAAEPFAPSDAPPSAATGTEEERTKPTTEPKPKSGGSDDDAPSWWLEPEPKPEPEAETPPSGTTPPSSGPPPPPSSPSSLSPLSSPADALLRVDRARVSPRGVSPGDVVALRASCAAFPAEARAISASARLEGGKRDAAFRAGVRAVLESDEPEGFVCVAVDVVGARSERVAPARFLSDLARDLGVRPGRAKALVADAAAREADEGLLRAGAKVRAGDAKGAEEDAGRTARALERLCADADEDEALGARLDVVAHGLEKILSDAERKTVRGLVEREGASERVLGAIERALGLR